MKKKTIPTLRVQALFRFSVGQPQAGTTLDPTITTITITTTGLPQVGRAASAVPGQR